MRARISPAWALWILLGLAAAGTAHAQSILLVEHKGKAQIVRAAREGRAMVEINGKLEIANGDRFILKKAEEYAPLFVSVRDAKARSSHLENLATGAEINHNFHFGADFETPYHLQRVFFVLEMGSEAASKNPFHLGGR